MLSWRSSSTAELWQEWEPQGAIEEAVGSWPLARRCRLPGEGVDEGHCSAAIVTFSYADCNGNVPPGHARVSNPHACLAICNTTVTRMIESLHTCAAHVRTAHEANEFPSMPTTHWPASYSRDAALCPGSAATTRAHHSVLHGCENHTHRDQTASNMNFRDQFKNPVSLHLKELFFWDITAIKYNRSEKLIDTIFVIEVTRRAFIFRVRHSME